MSKIRSSIPVCWTSVPFSRVTRCRRVGSGISSAVTIHGPKPPVAWKFLPAAIECLIGRRIDNRLGNRTQARAGALHVAGDHQKIGRIAREAINGRGDDNIAGREGG